MLSRQISSPVEASEKDEAILPSVCIIGSLTWEIESLIRDAKREEPDPGTDPLNWLYVPSAVRSKVIQWAHSGKFSCSPGKNHTVSSMQCLFLVVVIGTDVQDFVSACSTCVQYKVSNSPPAGLLREIPVLRLPWSHIVLDFITGLPLSSGNTC